MSPSFESEWKASADLVTEYIKGISSQVTPTNHPAIQRLRESMEYSSFEGGKRFRPVLALWTYGVFHKNPERVLPFAAALEWVHCYSLIHDDLPCMDNDDFRRGRPSNHKAFGEATALLAGNALLTAAFYWIAKSYTETPALGLKLTELLSWASGSEGMVGGQAIDMEPLKTPLSSVELDYLHSRKTGALISAAILGALEVVGVDAEQAQPLRRYGELLGLAFQVADDILDHTPGKVDLRAYPDSIGLAGARDYLRDLTQSAQRELDKVRGSTALLRDLAEFNLTRVF